MIAPIDITDIRIETPRLILRPWRESDLEDFYEYARVDGVGQMAGWMPHKNLEESRGILNLFMEGRKTLALEYKENHKVIGSLGINEGEAQPKIPAELKGREIGYVLSKVYWGQGLMPEAVKAVVDYCFRELCYDYLTCAHFVWNSQSRRVIEKTGFHYCKDILHETLCGTQEDTKVYIQFAPRRTELNELEKQLEGTVLETERLILRNVEDRDGEDCFVFMSHRETCYLDAGIEPFTKMDENYWYMMEKFKGRKARFVIWHKADSRVIGILNLNPRPERVVEAAEIGYVLNPAYRRQGYATEAVMKAISHLFEKTGVELVVARAVAHNVPSTAMLEKLGFTYEGNLHKAFRCPDQGVCDLKSYYLEK